MWVSIVVILLALAMVVGPVMMIRPSPGMARVGRLRTLASQRGLVVALPKRKEGEKRVVGAKYILPNTSPQDATAHIPTWSLRCQQQAHELHFDELWDWESEGRIVALGEPLLHQLLREAPEGVTGLSSDPGGTGVLWDESCRGDSEEEAIAKIKTYLEKVHQALAPF